MGHIVYWLVMSGLYSLSAWGGMALFSLQPSNITPLWLPAGVGLVMCLKSRNIGFLLILLTSFIVDYKGMVSDDSFHAFLYTFLISAVDAGQSYLAATLLKKNIPEGLKSAGDIFRLCWYVCFIPISVSSVVLSFILYSGHYINSEAAKHLVWILIAGDSLGVVIIYPLFSLLQQKGHRFSDVTPKEVVLFVSYIIMIIMAFTLESATLYLALGMIVYLAHIRHDVSVLVMLLLGEILLFAFSAHYVGPFTLAKGDQISVSMLIGFAFVMAFIPLSILFQENQLSHIMDDRNIWQIKAKKDVLTGLENRYGVAERLPDLYEGTINNKQSMGISLIDIDDFKRVNDQYGHLCGDMVLQNIARLLESLTQAGDLVARYGGEEFILALPGADIEAAKKLIDGMIRRCENTDFIWNGLTIRITISAGAIVFSDNTHNIEELIDSADENLYKAKHSGKNRLIISEL